jgi:hypothetical protein
MARPSILSARVERGVGVLAQPDGLWTLHPACPSWCCSPRVMAFDLDMDPVWISARQGQEMTTRVCLLLMTRPGGSSASEAAAEYTSIRAPGPPQ